MALVITELLGTDSIAGSRFTINANFTALKDEVLNIESVFGLSLTSGNIDVTAATGGSIKGKTAAFNSMVLPATGTPSIQLTGATGAIVGNTLVISTSLQTPLINITLGGAFNNQGTSVFDGTATFNEMALLLNGLVYGRIDVGSTATHTVLNSDRVIVFACASSPGSLTLTPDAGLIDGHVITFVKDGAGACFLDTTDIQGFGTGSIDFSIEPFKSTITLQWNTATSKWIVIGSSNMTIV